MVLLVMDMILVMPIIGLTFICTLMFNLIERIILWITLNTCCRRDKRLHDVILKNMKGHQKRNNKTSIMFNLAISFMIFSSSSFNLMTDMMQKVTFSIIGADMYADSTLTDFLDEHTISAFLNTQMDANIGSPVLDYAYGSIKINYFIEFLKGETFNHRSDFDF